MEIKLSSWYKILAPRPTVLVSTVNTDGISNAAPFSFVMPVSLKPPLVAFASAPSHHTVQNIIATKDFVVNIPNKRIINEMWACSEGLPAGVSEIKKSGLTEVTSAKVKSCGIKECIARFECRLTATYDAGDHVIVVGEVLQTDVSEALMKDGKYQINKAEPLMHIGGDEFGLPGDTVRPG